MKHQGEGAGGRAPLKNTRKSANMSRQKLLQLRRQALAVKRQKAEVQKAELKKAASRRIQSAYNKKTHKAFDHSILKCVQGGLVESIESLGETVSPLSLFMASSTALSRSPEKHHIPYILAIASACAPRLSQGVLLHQLDSAITLAEQIIAENVASNYLVVVKAMKFVQQLILSIQPPSMQILASFSRLEPSKLQVDTMKMYMVTFRKLLERAALSEASSSSSSHSVRDENTGAYILGENQKFFVEALPRFVKLCVSNFTDAPVSLVSSTTSELAGLFQRTLSPYIVESVGGREMIDSIVSTQLLELLKPHCQLYWGYALEVMEAFFDRLNYLKRTPSGDAMPFMQRFPSFPFVLRVLNKLRTMDDSKLNGKIERVMVSIGKGMRVQEFVSVISFDPRRAHDAELHATDATTEKDAWATSYVLNIIRRIAPHDSLPFFVEHFFPLIQFSRSVALEYEKQQRVELANTWTALLQQYWRVGVGFCHYPRTITKESFRDVAKQLVGLLSHPLFVDTSATALHVLCDGYHELGTTESLEDETASDNNADDREERLYEDQRETGTRGKRALPMKNSLEDDTHFLSLNDPTWNRHVYHGISQEAAKDVCENVIAKFSANIMPKLCNTFESHDSTAVLLAIQSFSRVCTPDVMQVILKGILDLGTNIALQTQEKDLAAGKKPNHTPLTGKRRMILDISCAVIAQLPVEHVVTLFNDIIEPVLMDPAPESRLLQKKAYKLLFAMFEHRIKDIFQLFPRIAGLLTVGRQHVTISGIKMRLRCLVWALDACKMYHPEQIVPMIRTIVGETIMLSRERSSETRAASMDLLEKMQRYLVGAGNPVNMLLHLVLAGFSGKTPWMVSSTVVAMAKLVYITHQELPEADLEGAIALGFRMMESAEPDVRSSAAMFARMVLKLMKRCPRVAAAMEKSLPKLLLAIALTTSQPRVSSNIRLQMRVLLEKCIKRFSFERLHPIFPIGSKNFLCYTQKMMRREQKKEERELKKRIDDKKNEFDRLFLGAVMKAGAEDDAERDLLQAGALTSFVSAYTVPSFAAAADAEDDGDELDTMHLEFQDGKLHIMSIEEKRQQVERQRRQEMANRLLHRGNHLAHADSLNERALGMRSKRSRSEAEDFENDELLLRYGSKINSESAQGTISTAQSRVGPGVNQIEKLRDQKLEKRELKRMRVEEDIRKGEEFKGTGEGDVRRGNVAPYAYIPLNRQYMNKRHQREALQRLMTVAHPHVKGNKAKLASRAKKRHSK
ncbi:ribosomal rRNA-processing protein 12 [Trypanosoma rangeli]|uniref:Ribosomal rRNA-processing protein 12 n=1 Tax=Trypanosoma rangeli TaxID=5698 RepID=A0A3R7RR52_TRYRA|nr:ribosomal rRNA-processing protein 12 [Trypanosoma rangeli]RNF11101.1 ribosomal rRNA-processing protein 12 [Trypanosoma rangeli]|eukprot:RNF11101.1 ribosomal rRNA-processing protein 12 [Trypanosoma rangeli]